MSTTRAQDLISANRTAFDGLIDEAARAIGESRFRTAAATLQSAARFAWYNHPGLFRSSRLEELAAQLGEHLPVDKSASHDLTGHVVHVLSQAYSSGGHTRLAWRWIENDAKRVNSVVITGQQGIPVPRQLVDAVTVSGGQIIMLGAHSSNLLVRAAELRSIAQSGVHTVVLHVHPYDVVPSIGLVDVTTSVVFLNHADHVFWNGGGVADVVADIRPAGQRLSLARRGIAEVDSVLLPIPLSVPAKSDRQASRARLNISPDEVVVISIASGYKYGASAGSHFIDIHRDFVLNHPEVILIVVGPESSGRWLDVSNETGGRFRAVGVVQGIDDYYHAADVYVDSIPFASLTSLLDAALRGVPVLALNETVPGSVLTSNDVSLSSEGIHFSERRKYIKALENLATRPEHRQLIANQNQEAVVNNHLVPGWNQQLEHLFHSLKVASTLPSSIPKAPETGAENLEELDFALVEFQKISGLSEPLWVCQLREAPYLKASERMKTLRAVPVESRVQSLKFAMPDVLRSQLKVQLGRFSSKLKRR